MRVQAAALNHRDLRVIAGDYGYNTPLVAGSDGAGVRTDTGEPVVILPSLFWGNAAATPSPEFEILGGPTDGTLATYVSVPTSNLYAKPEHLSWEEAAALPLVGLTAFRALVMRAGLRQFETLLVVGAGGGVATCAVQIASNLQAKVIVTSSSQEKIARARSIGASAGVLHSEPDWHKHIVSAFGGVDVVLDSVGSTWGRLLQCLRPGGRLVSLGATAGQTASIDIRDVYRRHLSVLGTTMGSQDDFAALIAHVERHRLRPVVDSVWDLDDIRAAVARLASGEHFGKIVIRVP